MRFNGYLWVPSPNHSSRRGSEPIIVTVHWTGGKRDAERVARIDYARKKKGNVSAHFTIDDDKVVQSVDTDFAAWHVSPKLRFMDGKKRANQRSIGIELCNRAWRRQTDGPRSPRGRKWKWARPLNPRAKRRQFEPYSEVQYLLLNELLARLCKQHPSIQYVCGHSDWCEDKPGAKLDPGPLFDWGRLDLPDGIWRVTYNYADKCWDHVVRDG